MKVLSNVRFTEPIFYLSLSFWKMDSIELITAATTAASAVKSWVFLILLRLKVLFDVGKRLCGAH